MRARTTARKAEHLVKIGVMIRWIAAITVTALAACVAAADPQQSGPSANGPIALSGADNKAASPTPVNPSIREARLTGESLRSDATSKTSAGEPMMIVPPASIANLTAGNSAAKVPPAGDPASEALWPSLNEMRGLGRAPAAKTSTIAGSTETTKTPATGTVSTPASRFSFIGSEVGRVVAALAVIIGLVMFARFFMKRAGGLLQGGDRPSGVVEILARYPVARGQQLVLLKLARRIMLLHQTGSSMTALTEMTDPDEVASMLARLEAGSSGRTAERFQKVLRSFESEHDGLPEIHTVRGPARLMQSAGEENEVIDLTRSRMRTLAGMLTGKVSR